MGAWIEIMVRWITYGVKTVAPYMGAWIEMGRQSQALSAQLGRTLHGCVD